VLNSNEIKPHDIRWLRNALNLSQAEFGRRLSIAAGKGQPYTRSYISSLEAGRHPISPEIDKAVRDIYAIHNAEDAPPFVEASIKAHPGQVKPGALFDGASAVCKWSDCGRPFIKTSPNQGQCPQCKRERKK